MEPRKKPIPSPLPRATQVRALVTATSSRALPTVAALLGATSLLACSLPNSEPSDITADRQVLRATVAQVSTVEVATTPLPGMGALETGESNPRPVDEKPIVKPLIKPVPTVMSPAGGLRPI